MRIIRLDVPFSVHPSHYFISSINTNLLNMKTSYYIPNDLRVCRKAAGLRQLDVAQKLGFCTTDRISRWEKGQGNPNMINLFKLAVIYRKRPEELYPYLFDALTLNYSVSANLSCHNTLEREPSQDT